MYQRIRKLISVTEAKRRFGADFESKKANFDNQLKEVIGGNGKFLLVVGPCSADSSDAVLSYCEQLRRIADKVSDKIFIAPRVYTTKPRSEVDSYRGMLHSPNTQAANFNEGIMTARKLMIDVAERFDFFAADEMLYPELYGYFDDVISYVTIGARSSENQLHRMMASGLDVPVGIKNPMHGELKSLARAIKIAYSPNDFVINGYEVASAGNKYAHAILRGFMDSRGEMHENYSEEYIDEFLSECAEIKINPAVIIDCNHANSGKNYLLEPDVAMSAVKLSKSRPIIKGLMIESYLLDGNQSSGTEFGKSLTDGCLGLERTERLIYDIADKL